MKTKTFPFPYSVADTESGPAVNWQDYLLTLSFTTWRNQQVSLAFHDAHHFAFFPETEENAKHYQYDGVVEVVDSQIIKQLLSTCEITPEEASELKHIVIGFNELGSYLSVVFSEFTDRSG
jgi:hypothetical protein